ncbi:hypothetical protein AND_007695 [Anopheles darlingi]|uniref:Uncharacterized protein n=1 Tax=Anopheles darlingi TaxID=43151 RepID=W5J9K5_ANODA|nr:hypothetical protein AND_007695 [Anopheles darlingi]
MRNIARSLDHILLKELLQGFNKFRNALPSGRRLARGQPAFFMDPQPQKWAAWAVWLLCVCENLGWKVVREQKGEEAKLINSRSFMFWFCSFAHTSFMFRRPLHSLEEA